MKGVLLSRCPDARVVDISHDVPPFSVHAGAYAMDQAAPYFPSGTVHVIVIDPGVGTQRKALLVEALEQYFIAPDNGVLSMIYARDRGPKTHEIVNHDLWLPVLSHTFHGRDIFAPVAAALASGVARPADVGPLLSEIQLLTDLEPEEIVPRFWRGTVLSIDRFGNVITNFSVAAFRQIATSPFTIRVNETDITRFRTTFAGAPQGLCFAYFGSSRYIEVGMDQDSAAVLLRASPGNSISLQL
jgi:S-adenosyl-L-methionine hydrolase (adenosine-forming)